MHTSSDETGTAPPPPAPPLDGAAGDMPAEAPPASGPDASLAPEPIVPTFTGSGKEYFRIWIVNLLLTVATLGIYSAWAKVRRLQYFYRNTQLAGASFDFHGDPRVILKGRLFAVVLLIAYQYAFGFSLAAGSLVAGALIVGLPFLMRSALRFRLSNTSYRGLAFGFRGSLTRAYAVYLPPVLTFFLPGVLLGVMPNSAIAAAPLLLYFFWPLMHGAMKGYQQGNLAYGDVQAGYAVPARRFYRPYLVAGLLAMLGMLCALVVLVILMYAQQSASTLPRAVQASLFMLNMVVPAYLVFLLVIPFMQSRLTNLVWSNTSLGPLRFRSNLTAGGLLRLHFENSALTVLTLGLFRPFAVVRTWEYRLAHLAVEADGGLEQAAARTQPRSGAGGDGAADFLGVDISW